MMNIFVECNPLYNIRIDSVFLYGVLVPTNILLMAQGPHKRGLYNVSSRVAICSPQEGLVVCICGESQQSVLIYKHT